MVQRWSERISESLAVRLPPDVVDWMDGDIRGRLVLSHPGLFTEAIDPERLIDPNSVAIWGGQMLPDTLPVLDSGCSDVISLRFGRDGHVREVIRWDHPG